MRFFHTVASNPVCWALAAWLPAGAWSAEPAPGEDGRALADPQVLQIIGPAGRGQLDEDQARRITAVLMADGKLDPLEIDLVDEIISEKVRAINIRPVSGETEMRVVGTQWGATKQVFEDLMKAHYAELYEDENAARGWEALIRQSLISSSAYGRVRQFLLPKVEAEARASTIANTYAPARQLLSGWFARHNQLPEELQDRSRWLMYSTYEAADSNMNGQLPDFLYNWVRPKPAQ